MPTGAVPLSDYPADMIALACSKCERGGRYRNACLVAIHGADIGLPDLRVKLAADCSLTRNRIGNDTCAAVYPELVPEGLVR